MIGTKMRLILSTGQNRSGVISNNLSYLALMASLQAVIFVLLLSCVSAEQVYSGKVKLFQ